MEDDKLGLTVAEETYLQRLSIIWTSPLSDANRVKATNQFALLVLTYPIWTQHWPLGDLQSIDRETRKLNSENGRRHPLSSTAVLYFPRDKSGRGLKSVEQEYKLIKTKMTMRLYENPDPMKEKVEDQRWQGRLLWTSWEDDQLSEHGCFARLSAWACAPTHTSIGVIKLYEQLLPTRVYAAYKTSTLDQLNTMCRMCGHARKPCKRFEGMFIAGAIKLHGQA